MKKTLSIVLALVLALAALTGCGSAASTPAATEAPAAADTAADTASDAAEAPAELEVIKVGATATPHGEILESIKDALAAGYTSDDALAYECNDSEATETYANVVAVRSGDENSAKIQALVKALQTDAVKQFINDTYKGSVVAYF